MNIKELIIYWRVIKKRLWLIILVVVATLAAMVTISYFSPPVYQTSTSFQVIAPLPEEVSIFREFRTGSTRDELGYTRNNFLSLLRSKFLLRQVIQELELDTTPEKLLEDRIVIETEETSDFVTLTVTAENPQLAALIANTIVEKAAHNFGALSAGSLTVNREFIQQQLQKVKTELDQAKTNLVQFQIENRVGSLEALLAKQQSLLIDLKLNRDIALAKGEQTTVLAYDGIIATRERELQDLILLTVEADTLQSNVGTIQRTYGDLLDRDTEAGLKENEILSAKFVQIIPAYEPEDPLPQFNIPLLIVGGIVSFVVGIILAFLLQALHDLSISSKDEDKALLTREDSDTQKAGHLSVGA